MTTNINLNNFNRLSKIALFPGWLNEHSIADLESRKIIVIFVTFTTKIRLIESLKAAVILVVYLPYKQLFRICRNTTGEINRDPSQNVFFSELRILQALVFRTIAVIGEEKLIL